jgi:molybdopterin-containing oxidoreductase family membrane subunit
MAHDPALLAIFPYLDDLLGALRLAKKEGFSIQAVFSPIHFSGIQEILGHKPSKVRYFCLAGGILGGVSLVSLAVYAHLSFRFVTSGKPLLPWVPFVVVFFEGMVLLAVISTVAAWILKARLPRVRLHPAYDPRFSEDRFGIVVGCRGEEREAILRLLRDAGAEEIRDVAG